MRKHKSRFGETRKCGNSKLYKNCWRNASTEEWTKQTNEMNEFIVRIPTPLRQAKKLKQFSLSFENVEIDEIHI